MNISSLKQRYKELDNRDQKALLLLTVFFAALITIYGILIPVHSYYQSGKSRLAKQVDLFQWVSAHAPKVKLLASQPQQTVSDTPLMEAVTGAAKGLKLEINRMQPEKDGLRIWLSTVSFEKAINLVSKLTNQHSISVDQITIEKTAKPGLVNIQCALSRVQ
ncbi:type II secretion system protein M [bacterium SCSIO 12696]|nr:type II secretion system protein M [bacterium SCSIO 12696]